MECAMTFIESLIISIAAVSCCLFIATLVWDLFSPDDRRLPWWEIRERRKRRGQVRRAAKKAGMSFREYSIRHFS